MIRKLLIVAVLLMLSGVAAGQENDTIKGIELYRSGNYTEAITVLRAVVTSDPKAKWAWQYLGGALLYTGDKKEAAKAFKNSMIVAKNIETYDKDLKITKKEFARYTQEARDNNVSGTVSMLVEFKSDGKVGFVFPIKTLPFGMTERATEAAALTKFEPAVKTGQPVTIIRLILTSFDIR